jgi:D-alanine-D-alanine ligase
LKRFAVAVIGGGWSGERGISLRSMDGVFHALKERGWDVRAIDLLPDAGKPRPASAPWAKKVRLSALAPELRRKKGTVAFLALHGPGGEDGRLQGFLELAGLPFTGSGALASALAMDKAVAKQLLRDAGLPVPAGLALKRGMALPGALRLPAIIKPVAQGSTQGLSLVKTRAGAQRGLLKAWRWDEVALVEPYLQGRELTVAVLGSSALPVVEIQPVHQLYDFHSKYAAGGSRHLCPAPLAPSLAVKIQAAALKAHRVLGCRGYSRTDVILGRGGRFHILELNTLPGLTSVSLLPDAAKAAGLGYGQLLEIMLHTSLSEGPWRSTKA